MKWLLPVLAACHTPAPSSPCWATRTTEPTRFAMRGDGTLVVVESRRIAQLAPGGRVIWEAPIDPPGVIEAVVLDARADVVVVGQAARPEASGSARLPGCFATKRAGTDGHALWTTQVFGTGTQLCRAVATDAAGDVYVAGYFAGSLEGPSIAVEASTLDIVVMRLAGADGEIRWLRRFGGRGTDVARTVAVDRSGTVIVGGSFSGDVEPAEGVLALGATEVRSAGDHDGLVFALSAAGDPLWATSFGDVGFDLVKSVAIASDGALYVAGAWMRPQDFHGEAAFHEGTMDGFVAKHTRSGDLVWRRIYTGGDGSQAHQIVLSAAGPIVVGHFKRTVDLGGRVLDAAGEHYAAYVAGFSWAGGVRWARHVGEPAAQFGYWVAIGPGGSLVVGGRSEGTGQFCGKPSAPAAVEGDHYLEWSADRRPEVTVDHSR